MNAFWGKYVIVTNVIDVLQVKFSTKDIVMGVVSYMQRYLRYQNLHELPIYFKRENINDLFKQYPNRINFYTK